MCAAVGASTADSGSSSSANAGRAYATGSLLQLAREMFPPIHMEEEQVGEDYT